MPLVVRTLAAVLLALAAWSPSFGAWISHGPDGGTVTAPYDVGRTDVVMELAIPSAPACGAARASGPNATWTCETSGAGLRCR